MKRPIVLLFCLLMIASSLAGCIGGEDTVDDSAVTELENEIVMQDEKIAELEAEIANLTIENQQALTDLAAVQSTLQTTQTSLDSAEANVTMHQVEISSLEAERDMAQAEISMLYELMSNMSDQSNETFESVALQIAELNQHMSNLSSMLNESYERHQENSTLAAGFFSQIQSLSSQLQYMTMLLDTKNASIYNLDQIIIRTSFEAESSLTALGMLVDIMKDPAPYGGMIYRFENEYYNSKIYLTNFDFNHSDWDDSSDKFQCNDDYAGGEWVLSCVILDNSSFRYSIIGEFDGASVKYTDFSYSEGTYPRFRNANVTHAVFAHSEFESGMFNNADLTYTDFNNVTFTTYGTQTIYKNDFSNSNLSYSNFNDASLYGLTLTNADLTGATFVGTTFVGNNVWSNTICPDGTNSNDNGNTCENNL